MVSGQFCFSFDKEVLGEKPLLSNHRRTLFLMAQYQLLLSISDFLMMMLLAQLRKL